ncbi:MAG: 2Fe-2S iron-sulfur cluster-binding protein [Cyanobacteria bacterium P01_D01_bin.105]
MLKTKVINTHTNDVYEAELTPRAGHQSECLIGRHPNCDLVLEGPAVSRVHGRVLFEPDACFFVDLGSTDGSLLNNEETVVNQSYAIAPNDVLRIGEFAVIVESVATHSTSNSAPATRHLWTGGEISARCVQIIAETHDVKTFRFVAEPAVLFNFKPGQFVTLTLPIQHPQTGRQLTRAYSISSSPARPHTLDITVKRVGPANDDLPPGVVSNWLHDCLEVGMTLPIQGPFGDFNCVDHPAQKLLLISAGSGITPMMSMAQWLSDRATGIDITFVHTARTAQDIIFRQRLSLLAAQYPTFKLAFSLTKLKANQGASSSPWCGYRGRLNPAMLATICPDYAERTAFVCGPNGFMSSTKQLLQGMNFPMENYFEESFGGPTSRKSLKPSPGVKSENAKSQLSKSAHPLQAQTATDASSNTEICSRIVEFSASGKQISCDEEDTLLDAAEQAGVSLTSGCRMGSCGVCKQQLQSGAVDYDVDPKGLSEGDRADGHVLTCIAKPVGKVVLSL